MPDERPIKPNSDQPPEEKPRDRVDPDDIRKALDIHAGKRPPRPPAFLTTTIPPPPKVPKPHKYKRRPSG